MIKTIYLAKRNPATSYDEFVANWRQHAVLSGSFPEVGRRFDSVIQCKRVVSDLADDLGLTQEFDGANLLGLRSLFDAVDVYNQEGIPVLRTDEKLSCFGLRVRRSDKGEITYAPEGDRQ